MKKQKLAQTLAELTDKLVEATQERDEYEVEYEFEKAKMFFTEGVIGLGNQVMREAQVTINITENGSYRKMAELRTNAKIAWYQWSAIKSLIDGKINDD